MCIAYCIRYCLLHLHVLFVAHCLIANMIKSQDKIRYSKLTALDRYRSRSQDWNVPIELNESLLFWKAFIELSWTVCQLLILNIYLMLLITCNIRLSLSPSPCLFVCLSLCTVYGLYDTLICFYVDHTR